MIVQSVIAMAVARRSGCPIQASLSEKDPRSENGDDGFFSLLGRHQDLDLAVPDIKHRIGGLPLFEDNLVLSKRRNGPAAVEGGEKHLRVELGFSLPGHRKP